MTDTSTSPRSTGSGRRPQAGPPLLAPGSLCLVGGLGLAAAIVKREAS